MRKNYLYLFLVGIVLIFGGAACDLSLTGEQGLQTSGPAGMFASVDKGENWRPISSLPTVEGIKNLTGVSVYRLFTDPQDSSALYWGSRSNGLFYSFDDGKAWFHSVDPLSQGFIYSVAVHPKDRCSIYATNGRQLFRTDDCLRSWSEVFEEVRPEVSIRTIAIDPFGDNHVYIAEDNGDMLKSEDQGAHWSVVSRFGISVPMIKFDANKQGLIYVASREEGLYRSKDGGVTWESLKNKLEPYTGSLEFRKLLVHPNIAEKVYWISEYGIMESRNAGEDWDAYKLVTPPGSTKIYGFAINPNNDKEIYYTGTVGSKSTFYRSVNGGQTWETRKLPSGQIPTELLVHPEHGDWVYVGFTIPPQG